jgi:hypothetical protein
MPSPVHPVRAAHAFVIFAALLGSCEHQRPASAPDDSPYLPPDLPGGLDRCSIYDCGSNSPLVNRFPINGLRIDDLPNDEGFVLGTIKNPGHCPGSYGSKLESRPSRKHRPGDNPTGVSQELVVKVGPHQCAGAALEGVVFHVEYKPPRAPGESTPVVDKWLEIERVYKPCDQWMSDKCVAYRYEYRITPAADPSGRFWRFWGKWRGRNGGVTASLCERDVGEIWRTTIDPNLSRGDEYERVRFDDTRTQSLAGAFGTFYDPQNAHVELLYNDLVKQRDTATNKIYEQLVKGGDAPWRLSDELYHPSDNVVVMTGAVYAPNGDVTMLPAGTFQLVCVRDALAKLDIARIVTSGRDAEVDRLKTRQAALRMMSGRYCTRSVIPPPPGERPMRIPPGTVHAAGILKASYENCLKQTREFDPAQCFGEGPLEALWDQDGAICLDRVRLSQDAGRAALASQFPAECRKVERGVLAPRVGRRPRRDKYFRPAIPLAAASLAAGECETEEDVADWFRDNCGIPECEKIHRVAPFDLYVSQGRLRRPLWASAPYRPVHGM